jgi:uncharacterized protein
MRNDHEELKIRISGLSNGVHEYHLVAQPADMGLDDAFRTPVSLDVSLEKSTRQIYLKSEISAAGNFICDRCLEGFEKAISGKMNTVYVFSQDDAEKNDEDEIRIIAPETMNLDITDDARQAILLFVPLKLLCREDCKGLCPHCGVNWNQQACRCRDTQETDTRWESLKKIQ